MEKLTFVTPNDTHCRLIADAIREENKQNPHMIEQNPVQLFLDSLNHGGISLVNTADELIAFVKLSVTMSLYKPASAPIYEMGGLYVMPDHRGK